MFNSLSIILLIACIAYSQYLNPSYGNYATDDLDSLDLNNYPSPVIPMAPPRIPAVHSAPIYKPPPIPASRNAVSDGTCIFDHSKWRMEPQTTIANAIMFDRTTGISCEECLEKCTQIQDQRSEWICRTLTYDHNWKICDLFAVNGTSYSHFLAEYAQRDYFVYLNAKQYVAKKSHVEAVEYVKKIETKKEEKLSKLEKSYEGQINMKAAKQHNASKIDVKKLQDVQLFRDEDTLKVIESCKKGEKTSYVVIAMRLLVNPGDAVQFIESSSMEQCSQACDANQLFECKSATLSPYGCELTRNAANHGIDNETIFASNTTYMEKVCMPSELSELSRKYWPAVKNYVIVGHVVEVVDARSLAECMIACLKATQAYGFVCKSAMWYPSDEDQNCLLNSENRVTQPDVFVEEDEGVEMIYFDSSLEQSTILKNTNGHMLRDLPLHKIGGKQQYTKWSSCSSSDSNHSRMRYRYLKCKEQKDVRKCSKQSFACPQTEKTMSAKCVAVRDSFGRKRCPHGIRRLPNGQNDYCTQPIDC